MLGLTYGLQKISTFAGDTWKTYEQKLLTELLKEINSADGNYILNVSEQEYKEYLYGKYFLDPLEIISESESIENPEQTFIDSDSLGRSAKKEAWRYHIKYYFKGNPELLSLKPSQFLWTTRTVFINAQDNWLYLRIDLPEASADALTKQKGEYFDAAFKNLPYINYDAGSWNLKLMGVISENLEQAKNAHVKKNGGRKKTDITINESTKLLFSPAVIKRKQAPRLPSLQGYGDDTDIIFDMMIYKDILNIIALVFKTFEKKESLYRGKSEEDLRDDILMFLETRYDSVLVTGETFQKLGSSDILLKNNSDGADLFTAEFKFWDGPAGYNEALNHLLSGKLKWPDSKAALVIFVKDNDFTAAAEKVRFESSAHKYFVKEMSRKGKSSFSNVFRFSSDPNKTIYIEVMLFHLP